MIDSRKIIYPVQERPIHLAPVVLRVDNAIHRINHYPLDSTIGFSNTYWFDSDLLSNFWTTGMCFLDREVKNHTLSSGTSLYNYRWNEGVPPAIIYAIFFLSIGAGFPEVNVSLVKVFFWVLNGKPWNFGGVLSLNLFWSPPSLWLWPSTPSSSWADGIQTSDTSSDDVHLIDTFELF